MAAPSNTNKIYYDILGSFELGVNSGVSPVLLPKNQLSWAINSTVRGGHISHRPPLQKQTLNYNGDTALQAIVESGYYQGAGVYRPDFGASQIIAQIGGHIIRFTPVAGTWTVDDISIAGDLNTILTTPVWMWQSENWLIITDGSAKLPIFYDGTSCRRSYGPSQVLGTTIASGNFPATRVIGEIITVNLAAAWTGGYNYPVIFNGHFYEPITSAGTNTTITTVYATAANVLAGASLSARPSLVGRTTIATASLPGFFSGFHLTFGAPHGLAIGDSVVVLSDPGGIIGPDYNYPVSTIVNVNEVIVFRMNSPAFPAGLPLAAGALIGRAGNTSPDVIIGTVSTGFAVPAIGASLNIDLSVPYSGPANQIVWIGNDEFLGNVLGGSSVGVTLELRNLSDTTDAGAAIPTEDILSVPELPAGRMGAYGMGRNWMCLTDGLSYIASDIVGGAAGTVATNYRDAVLKITENDFLAGGGTFRLPASGNIITAMIFVANLDTSLGQGALQIGTDTGFFSNNCTTDRSDWAALQTPLQTQSLIGQGPLAQNSTVVANSDVLFRSVDGVASLIIARRNFGEEQSWGNTSISREVTRGFENDNISLLTYGSAVTFDNRMLMTCYPSVAGVGVFHQGVIALNFDLVSSLRGKAPPVYDGLWTGLNFLQCLSGNFSGTGRCYAFGFNQDTSIIELYELQRATDGHFDNGSTRIEWPFETAALFREDIKPKSELIRLLDAEIEVQDVDGVVDFEVQYKPDYYPCWTTWRTFQICADQTGTDAKPGYRTRLSLGDPTSDACETANNRPTHIGHFFQFRIKVTGHCDFMGMRVQATTQPEADFGQPVCADVTSDTIPVP